MLKAIPLTLYKSNIKDYFKVAYVLLTSDIPRVVKYD